MLIKWLFLGLICNTISGKGIKCVPLKGDNKRSSPPLDASQVKSEGGNEMRDAKMRINLFLEKGTIKAVPMSRGEIRKGVLLLEEWATQYQKGFTRRRRLFCRNGGQFVNNGACLCRRNYFGDRCQFRQQIKAILKKEKKGTRDREVKTVGHRCVTEPCLNGGDCLETVVKRKFSPHLDHVYVSVRCVCRLGFKGPTCEQKVHECEDYNNSQCDPNNLCISTPDGFKCVSLELTMK